MPAPSPASAPVSATPNVTAARSAGATARDAWMPARADASGPGVAIALVVHLGLVVVLALGVQWRSSKPAVMEAELWAQVPQAAAPRDVLPPPAPPPPPVPTPPRPQATPAPPERDAEIALEQRRREQAAREQEQRERAAREAREKAAREREAREREQQRQAAAQQQREERQQQQRREQQAREAAERAEAQRQSNLERLQGLAGGTGAPNATGTAARSAGPSATYAGRLVAAVKPNIVFPDTLAGNPAAEVEVRAGPTGTILGRTLVRSSGVREWDEAVLRAIDRTETLPRDTDGRVPSTLIITFRPRD